MGPLSNDGAYVMKAVDTLTADQSLQQPSCKYTVCKRYMSNVWLNDVTLGVKIRMACFTLSAPANHRHKKSDLDSGLTGGVSAVENRA